MARTSTPTAATTPWCTGNPRGTDGQDSTKPPQPAGSAQAPTAPAPTPTGTPAAASGAAPPATADDMQHHDPPQLHSTLSTTTQSAGQPPAEKIEKEASGQASASGTTGEPQSGRQRRSRRGHRVPRGRRQGRQRRCYCRSPVQPWWTADRRGRGRYRGGRQRSARSGVTSVPSREAMRCMPLREVSSLPPCARPLSPRRGPLSAVGPVSSRSTPT